MATKLEKTLKRELDIDGEAALAVALNASLAQGR